MKSRYVVLKRLARVCILGSSLVAVPFAVQAAEDPYVNSNIISPAPLAPVEFAGAGTVTIVAGNAGSDPLSSGVDGNVGSPMTIRVNLNYGVPDAATPLAALGGDMLSAFSFTYNVALNTYFGTATTTIPGNTDYTLTVAYKVDENRLSTDPTPNNGAGANISPGGNGNGSGTNDGQTSTTWVEASDDGDLPNLAGDGSTPIYGSALHNIDLDNIFTLGSHIDHETDLQPSDGAVGDDGNTANGLNGTVADDEDGVDVTGSLTAGTTNNLPLTFNRNGFGGGLRWYVWVDWNRNGVLEAGEGTFQAGFPAFGIPDPTALNVPVPATVDGDPTLGYYYMRVRLTSDLDTQATGTASNGEVEDYVILVGNPTAVVMGDVDLDVTRVGDYLTGIGADQLDAASLLALLQAWDPAGAAALQNADAGAILDAMRVYLDADGDGQVVVFSWETVEERGTIGFYAEREQDDVWTRINGQMLPGLIAAPMGAQYWLADPGAQADDDYRYRLLEVDAWGNTSDYGPFDLRATAQ